MILQSKRSFNLEKLSKGCYNLGTLLESEEEELTDVCDDGSGVHTLGVVVLIGDVVLVVPLNLALNLALEVRRVLRAVERHLDVLVRVGLQLARHWLQLNVVAAKIISTAISYHMRPDLANSNFSF